MHITALPVEVLCKIVEYLPSKQLSTFTINKVLYEISASDVLWKGRCLAHVVRPLAGSSYKKAYIEHLRGYCHYFFKNQSLFSPEFYVSEKKQNVFEKREAIDQALTEEENHTELAELLIMGIESEPAADINYLIEAGALNGINDKKHILDSAIENHYPITTVVLLIKHGVVLTEDILKDIIEESPLDEESIEIIKKLILTYLGIHGALSEKILEMALFKLPDELILVIMDHCKVNGEHLKTAIYKSSDLIISRLVEIGKLLNSENVVLLYRQFCFHRNLFFRLYLKSCLPLTSWFLKEAVVNILLQEISLETFLEVVEVMRLADVRFTQKILEFSIESKMEPKLFEILLTSAEETISLEQLILFASQADVRDERIINLIEKRISVKS